MKMLFSTVALAVVLATPALSQTADRLAQSSQPRTYDPYVYAPAPSTYGNPGDYQNRLRSSRSINPRNDVYDQQGDYVGSDPDPLIRDQLRRDPTQGD